MPDHALAPAPNRPAPNRPAPNRPAPPRRRPTLALLLLAVAIVAFACRPTLPGMQSQGGPGSATGIDTALERHDDGRREDLLDPDVPSIANLDPDLLAALRAATRDASADGVTLVVNSGWRSREHQERLLAEAVSRYGSEEEARRYVATPETSAHVTGDAVDIGPSEATTWLREHGADYGLCQVFANEVWHYELATTPGDQCPEMLPDSSSPR